MKVKIISNYDEAYVNMGESNFSIVHYSDKKAISMTETLIDLMDSEIVKTSSCIQNSAWHIASEMAKMFNQIANETSLQQQILRVLIRMKDCTEYKPIVWYVEFGNSDEDSQVIPLISEKSIQAYIVTEENKTFRRL